MVKGQEIVESSVARERARDFYKVMRDDLVEHVKKLQRQQASPYRLTTIRFILRLFERYIGERYEQEYKIDFTVNSGVLERFRRQSMVVFNDNQAHVVLDRDVSNEFRFYWIMHEAGHILSSFEEFDQLSSPESLLALNYSPRLLEKERSYCSFAFELYDKAFGELKNKPPTTNYRSLLKDEIWPLVAAYSIDQRHWKRPALPALETPFLLEDDYALANQMTNILIGKIGSNLENLHQSLGRMELALEGD